MRKKIILFLAILAIAVLVIGCKQQPAKENISDQPKAAENITPTLPAQPATNETAPNVSQLIIKPSANETLNVTVNETAGNMTQVESPQVKQGSNLTVHFINVRHGDSVYIQSPNGGTMLIDGGFNSQGGPLMHYLRDLGMKDYLDAMLSSNVDSYHMGGLGAVLFNVVTVGEIYYNGRTSDDQSYLAFSQFGSAKGKMTIVSKDMTVPLDENMQINLLAPYMDNYFNKTEDNSIVTKIIYGKVSFLLMSDCTEACEKKLMGRDVKADILKVAHYAWNDSTSKEFLEQVDPKVAIISTGDFAEFDVPDSLLLQRLVDRGIDIYRTDVNGTIVVTTDGNTYSIKTYKPAEE